MRQSRTPLLRALQKALKISFSSENICKEISTRTNPSNDSKGLQYSRRTFLNHSFKAGSAALATISLFPTRFNATEIFDRSTPKIVIIGGGMAGLNAAYTLLKAGYRADIYEASDSTGGRIHTDRNVLAEGLTTEVGGEFIDSNHIDMIRLAKEFNLTLLDTRSLSETKLIKDSYFINGTRYTEKQVVSEFAPIAKLIMRDQALLPEEMSYHKPQLITNFDKLSIDEYLYKLGVKGWLLDLFKAAFTSEYGLETGNQSSINFLNLIGSDTTKGKFDIFGESDERFKIKGGNDLLIRKLVDRLKSQITTSAKLLRIKKHDQRFSLTFSNNSQIEADIVILAIPFSVLRYVEMTLEMPLSKKRAITELGYGTNSKLVLGFNSRIWRAAGASGYTFNNVIQNGWDNSQLQNGNSGPGGFTVFLGGNSGKELSKDKEPLYLKTLDKIYKGAIDEFNGQSRVYNWTKNPFTEGSYACYKVGQWSSFSGVETEPVGNLFFAGEHCSKDFQGYMNGAAETGRKTALSVIQKIKAPKAFRAAK